MADLVTVAGMSHAPMMLATPESAPDDQRRRFFSGVAEATSAARGADAVVICSNEHFTNFFYDHMPAFCVGVGESHLGPVEEWLGIPQGEVPGHAALATEVMQGLIATGFEPSFSHELKLDHGVMTVYHALSPDGLLPLVPLIQNCAVAPMPSLRRCFELGRALGDVLRRATSVGRVAVVGAGGLSHWVGAPRVGEIDEGFDRWFLDHLARGEVDDVLDMPDAELEQAGNGAHEIRSWLTAAGVAWPQPARVLAYEPIQSWITGMAVAVFG